MYRGIWKSLVWINKIDFCVVSTFMLTTTLLLDKTESALVILCYFHVCLSVFYDVAQNVVWRLWSGNGTKHCRHRWKSLCGLITTLLFFHDMCNKDHPWGWSMGCFLYVQNLISIIYVYHCNALHHLGWGLGEVGECEGGGGGGGGGWGWGVWGGVTL